MAPPDLHKSLTRNVRLRSKQSRTLHAPVWSQTQAVWLVVTGWVCDGVVVFHGGRRSFADCPRVSSRRVRPGVGTVLDLHLTRIPTGFCLPARGWAALSRTYPGSGVGEEFNPNGVAEGTRVPRYGGQPRWGWQWRRGGDPGLALGRANPGLEDATPLALGSVPLERGTRAGTAGNDDERE